MPEKTAKEDSARARLAAATLGLRASRRADPSDLDVLTRIVAAEIRRRPDYSAPDADSLADDADLERVFGPGADTDLEKADLHPAGFVRPRDAFASLAALGLGPRADVAALAPSRRLGPFDDLAGLRRDFDLFLPAGLTALTVKGAGAPALLFSSAQIRRRADKTTVTVSAGTVWIAARLLDPAAPGDAYAGLPVTGGTGRFTGGDPSALDDPLDGTLELDLAYAPDPEHACEAADIKPPKTLKIAFGPAGVQLSLDGGSATLDGQTIEFSRATGVRFVGALNGLLFETKARPDTFRADAVDWRLAKVAEALEVKDGGWFVPVTRTTTPLDLPLASGLGFWLARLAGRAAVGWASLEGTVELSDPVLTIGFGRFALLDVNAQAAAGATSRYALWPLAVGDADRRQPFDIALGERPVLALGCAGDDRHFLAFSGSVAALLSRPVDHRGRPLDLPDSTVLALHTEEGKSERLAVIGATPASPTGAPVRLVGENAVMRVHGPAFRALDGRLEDGKTLTSGALELGFQLANWLPTLPDPYVSSAYRGPVLSQETDTRVPVRAAVGWRADPAHPPKVAFAADLPAPQLARCNPTKPYVRPIDPKVRARPGQTAGGVVLRSEKEQAEWARARKRGQAAQPPENTATAIGNFSKTAGPLVRRGDVSLLDVSTARHQIGVELLTRGGDRIDAATHRKQPPSEVPPSEIPPGGEPSPEPERPGGGDAGGGSAAHPFVLQGLAVGARRARLRVFALPQIQWEPVRTLDADQDLLTLGYFPTPLASASDGGRAVVSGRSARLAPAIPDIALEDMIAGFGSGERLDVLTTLPFGIRAALSLRPAPDATRAADRAELTRPTFDAGQDFTGAHHLTLHAGKPTAPPPRESASFEGIALQTLNGVDLTSGAPLNISVLGATAGPDTSVEAMFNGEFAIARPRVPTTRLDLSGYGGSTFSDWANPFAAFAEAAKVQFQVMVGRTALEVVKFVSTIYPWGIRATRTVTIERQGGGGVLRRDSGWQAASPGLFDFRRVEPGQPAPSPTPYDIHPGLVRGVFDVTRIRPADRSAITLPDGGKVYPMAFDCVAEIGTQAGHRRTPMRGAVGYLHLEPVGNPITPRDLGVLLETQGPAGGPVDTLLALDASGFRCRVRRVEAGHADDGGTPVLVGALRGAPQFGPSGAWAVAAFSGPGDPDGPEGAEAVPDGVPIVREGLAADPVDDRIVVPAPANEIRFLDPGDLFRGAAPRVDYAFVQATPTHSFAFRRPHIPIGSRAIRAGLPALFADIFARTAGAGLFPPEDVALTLGPAGAHRLEVSPASGFFRLVPPVGFAPGAQDVLLSDSADAATRLDYDETSIDLRIEESEWSLTMPHLKVWTDILGLEDMSGMRASLVGGTHVRPQLVEIGSLMHPTLESMLEFLPGFLPRSTVPPIDLAATNVKFKGKIKTVAPGEFSILGLKLKIAAVFEAGQGKVDIPPDLLPPGSDPTVSDATYVGGSIVISLDGTTPTTPWKFVYGVKLKIGGKTYYPELVPATTPGGMPATAGVVSTIDFSLKAYIGIGFGGGVGGFEAIVAVGLGPVIAYDSAWAFGGFIFFKAEVDLTVVTVGVAGEFSLMIVKRSDGDYAKYAGEVGIYVKLLFFSIEMSVGISQENRL